MKKLFLILYLIGITILCANAQSLTIKNGRIFDYPADPAAGQRVLNFSPYSAAYYGSDTWRNTATGKMFKATVSGGVWVWTQDTKWGGGTGLNSFTIGTVTTLAAGQNATVTNTGTAQDPVINFGIPRGSTGATGASGSGSGSNWLTNVLTGPDKYYATHDSSTIASHGWNTDSITAKWPTSGATTAWTVDRAAWQEAVNDASDNRKKIITYGHYWTNGMVVTPGDVEELIIEGPGFLHGCGTVNFALLGSISPTDNTDANLQVSRRFIIRDMSFGGNRKVNTLTGLSLGPSYMSRYDNLKFYDCDTAIMQRFQLGTLATNIEVNNANTTTTGRMGVWTGIGNWSGASNSNSQSNSTMVFGSRYYMTNNTATAHKVFACSGVVDYGQIIEGGAIGIGNDVDGNNSTVVKDYSNYHQHFEAAAGATTAANKVRLAGGIATFDGAFGQYASIFCDAGSTGGYVSVRISNIPYWVAKSGKSFNNAGGTSWAIDWCDTGNWNGGAGSIAAFPAMWSGTAVSMVGIGTMQNGNNKATGELIVR